jgi:hypothetical protein
MRYARITLLSLVLWTISAPGFAQDWVKRVEFQTQFGYLGEGQEGALYDKRLYKFYVENVYDLQEDEVLVVTVESTFFQPIVATRDWGTGKIVTQGVIQAPDTTRTPANYSVRLEHHPSDRGQVIVIISTRAELDRGFYYINASIWGPPIPQTTEPPGIGDFGFPTSFAGIPAEDLWGPLDYDTHSVKGVEYGAAASMQVVWIGPGDTGTDAADHLQVAWVVQPWQVVRQEGNTYYLAPVDYGGRAHPVVIVSADRRTAVALLVWDQYVSHLDELVEGGRAALARAEGDR